MLEQDQELEKLFQISDFYSEEEEKESFSGPCGPCWGIKIDKENDKVFFSIDNKEVLSYPFSKIKYVLSRERLNSLLAIFKTRNLKALKKELQQGV